MVAKKSAAVSKAKNASKAVLKGGKFTLKKKKVMDQVRKTQNHQMAKLTKNKTMKQKNRPQLTLKMRSRRWIKK